MATSSVKRVSPRLQQIAKLARDAPQMVFTTLAHHIDIDLLLEAYRRTRKDSAPGVDGQTGADYAVNLVDNLEDLLNRFKSGKYRAPPVRRVHIPKGDGGKTRPIGIPTFEDKVLQRAVTMVLEAVYEQDFLSCSYGFRPGRSAHQALQALRNGLMGMNGGWVLDVDIQDFFGGLDHNHLRTFLDQRMRDGVIRRAIGKWLNAGVLDGSNLTRPDSGSPQGGVVTPPTQVNTFVSSASFVSLIARAPVMTTRNTIHYGGAVIINLNPGYYGADQLPLLHPSQFVETVRDSAGKVLESTDDSPELNHLVHSGLRMSQIVPCSLNPGTDTSAS